jgi:OPT oligopeptide transporter protein
MFLTQIYGTVLGGFINYVVMISIVNSNRALLVDTNGNSAWSGATIQAYNTNATSWALAKYLFTSGSPYAMVPVGLAVGGALVALHRLIVYVSFPRWIYQSTIN